jgi:hypothetical protein
MQLLIRENKSAVWFRNANGNVNVIDNRYTPLPVPKWMILCFVGLNVGMD